MIDKFDCIVVGAGMVGATTALVLADLGLTVALIDKNKPRAFSPEQAYDLRVSAISLSSEKLLDQINVWPQINQWRTCPYKRLGVWEHPGAYTEFNADEIKQPHLGHIVENRLLQLAAWQQIEQNSAITLFCPEQVMSYQETETGVEVSLNEQVIKGKLIIAADGANSQIRSLAGIGITGWDYQQSAMLINVTTDLPQQDITWQQFFETGPVAMLPLGGNNASLVWYHQAKEIQRLSALSNEQLTDEVVKNFPDRLGNIKVVNKASFALTRRHANQYAKNKVVLLGDAAHSINPLAGQGVNLGFKDVKALQIAMATAMGEGRSFAAIETLQAYEKARRADNLLMMSAMDMLYHTFSHSSVVAKGLRNLAIFTAGKVPQLKAKALSYACGI
ncbi:MAG: FAD-dependent oxidoreductase [Thalassotalea sp.]